MSPRFLQYHFLTSYPAALLNRDDAGFAKRLPFGGATRTRISSQCLKRHWRTFAGEHSLASLTVGGAAVPMSIRSRRTLESYVLKPLLDDPISPELAAEVTRSLLQQVFGESAKAKAARGKDADAEDETGAAKAPRGKNAAKEEKEVAGRTGQITVLGRPEVEFLLAEARAVCREVSDPKQVKGAVEARFKKDARKNLEALKHGAGLDAALFGRMVTSDYLSKGDAALHVAHAFTVHAEMAETDYFSAVDDLLTGGDDRELGSGHIGTTELASGLYYGYVVVDVPLLVSNLEGSKREDWQSADRSLAAQIAERFVHLFATVSPGAKLGSTAPYSYAHLLLVEAGDAQPRSLANAFLNPVRERPDLLRNAYQALADHLADLDAMYGRGTERHAAALGPHEILAPVLTTGQRSTLGDVAGWTAARVGGA